MIVTLTFAEFQSFNPNTNKRMFYAISGGNVTDVLVEKGFVDQTLHFQFNPAVAQATFLAAYPAAILVTSITEPASTGSLGPVGVQPVLSGIPNDILFVGLGAILQQDPKLTWNGITFEVGTVLTEGVLTFNTPAPSGPTEYFPMRLRRDSADGFTQLVVENTIAGGFCGFAAVDDDTGNDQLGEGFIAALYFGALGGSIDDSNFITLSHQGQIRTGLNAIHGMSIGAEVGQLSFFTGGINFTDERMRIDEVGNVVVSYSTLPTNSTDGFLYIPTSAGPPVGTPTSYSGRAPVEYDTVNNDFYIYYSGAWHKVHLTVSGATGGEYFADRYFALHYWTHNYFN